MWKTDTEYAGFWRRLQAWIVDSVLVVVSACMIALILGFPLVLTIGFVIKDKTFANDIYSLLGCTIGFFTYCSYFVGFEVSRLQATPGKILFNIIVTDMENERIGVLRAFGRLFGKLLSGFLLMLGFLICDFTSKKQTLHDILANTLVVRKTKVKKN